MLDKYDPESPPKFSQGDHRRRKAWFSEKGLRVMKERLIKIKNRFGCKSTEDLVHLSIKYCLSRDENGCTLVGFRSASQLKVSLSTEGYLTDEECNFIRRNFSGISEEIGNFIEFREV